ncbi:MAG: hypothetical protein MN733_21825 [Nitrososphaera sp.]|nr:hypothetical protein [Nitrososphaera sp.]
MKQSLHILLAGCCLMTACSSNTDSVGKGFVVVSVGGDSLLHVPPNLQLYYKPEDGSKIKVWPFLVAGRAEQNPAVSGDLAIFNTGLSDDKRWKIHPALMAYTFPGQPVEISKFVTRHWVKKGANKKSDPTGEYVYLLEKTVADGFEVFGFNTADSLNSAYHIRTTIPASEVRRWIEIIRAKGQKREYEGITYFIATGAEWEGEGK